MGVIRSRTLSKNNSRRNSSTSRQQHKAKIQQHGLLEETDFSDFEAPFRAASTVFDCVVLVTKAGVGRVKRAVG
jgi:hypothetical protein